MKVLYIPFGYKRTFIFWPFLFSRL